MKLSILFLALVCIVCFTATGYSASLGGQGDVCAANAMCGKGLHCAPAMLFPGKIPYLEGTWFCVGRGEQGDMCDAREVDKGSKSCGGSLVCKDVGGGATRCIGRGKPGDLCSKEESGSGSKHCGGKLKCKKGSDGVYTCR